MAVRQYDRQRSICSWWIVVVETLWRSSGCLFFNSTAILKTDMMLLHASKAYPFLARFLSAQSPTSSSVQSSGNDAFDNWQIPLLETPISPAIAMTESAFSKKLKTRIFFHFHLPSNRFRFSNKFYKSSNLSSDFIHPTIHQVATQ